MTGVILALVGARRYSDWLLLGSVLLQVACTFPEYEFVESESGSPRPTHGSPGISGGSTTLDPGIYIDKAAFCADGVRSGDESAPDCGGSCTARCAAGSACTAQADCERETSCTDGICRPNSCSDGMKNGTESGVDCGTVGCPLCGLNEACERSDQCVSGLCESNFCQPQLQVLYRCFDCGTEASDVHGLFAIVNRTNEAVPFAELELVYYYSDEAGVIPTFVCGPLEEQLDCSIFTGKHVPLPNPTPEATHAFEVGFNPGPQSIPARSTSESFAVGFTAMHAGGYVQDDDYSFDRAPRELELSPRIVLRRKGAIMWGIEPEPTASD